MAAEGEAGAGTGDVAGGGDVGSFAGVGDVGDVGGLAGLAGGLGSGIGDVGGLGAVAATGDTGVGGIGADSNAAGIAAGNAMQGPSDVGGILGGLGIIGGLDALESGFSAQQGETATYGGQTFGGVVGGVPAENSSLSAIESALAALAAGQLGGFGATGFPGVPGVAPSPGIAVADIGLDTGDLGGLALGKGDFGAGQTASTGGVNTAGKGDFAGLADFGDLGGLALGKGDFGTAVGAKGDFAGLTSPQGVPGGFGALQGEFADVNPIAPSVASIATGVDTVAGTGTGPSAGAGLPGISVAAAPTGGSPAGVDTEGQTSVAGFAPGVSVGQAAASGGGLAGQFGADATSPGVSLAGTPSINGFASDSLGGALNSAPLEPWLQLLRQLNLRA